jgi:colicin import membrane protein
MSDQAHTEETLQRLVAQLEAFYAQHCAGPPAARQGRELEAVATEAEALAARVERLARENDELAAAQAELEARCQQAEAARDERAEAERGRLEQIALLEAERRALVDACTAAREGLEQLEAEHAEAKRRSSEVTSALEEAEGVARWLAAEKAGLEARVGELESKLGAAEVRRAEAVDAAEARAVEAEALRREAEAEAEAERRRREAAELALRDEAFQREGLEARLAEVVGELSGLRADAESFEGPEGARRGPEVPASEPAQLASRLETENQRLRDAVHRARTRAQALLVAADDEPLEARS